MSTQLLQLFGVPVVREGVTLFVAQYQLLVEDACAGMNAILGLTSLGLFYAYLQHGASWRYCAALAVFIIPIALLANVVRIIILVLITWQFGNEAAQGYLHGTAGLVTFATGLLLVFALDSLLSKLALLPSGAVMIPRRDFILGAACVGRRGRSAGLPPAQACRADWIGEAR